MSRIRTCWIYYFAHVALDATAIANLAKYTLGFLKMDGSWISGPAMDWAAMQAAYVTPVKAANPDTEIGLYVGAGGSVARGGGGIGIDPAFAFASDAQCLHQPDGGVVQFTFGGVDWRWPNYLRDGVRSDHIAQYLAFLETYRLDAVFFDSWLPSFNADFLTAHDAESAAGSQEGPTHTLGWWLAALPTWTAELSAALEAEGYRVWANGVGTVPYDPNDAEDAFMGRYQENIVDYATGALMEHGHRTYVSAALLADAIAAASAVEAKGGELHFLCLSHLLATTDPAVAVADETTMARYYLAVYLLIQSERTFFGHQPYSKTEYLGFVGGTPAVYWSDDWEIDFGEPAGPATLEDGLWMRTYSKGVAVVNGTTSGATFTRAGSYRLWGAGPRVEIGPGDADDVTVTGVALPAFTGHWLSYERTA